jgi:hypothetical protein
MQVKYRQFPHPVLSSFGDDITGCEFKVEFNEQLVDGNLKCSLDITMNNTDLIELITEDKASYVFHIECSATRYREAFKIKDISHELYVDAHKIDEKIELSSFIVALENMDNYTNKNFNDDYDGMSFKIRKGDILAVGNSRVLKIDKEEDALRKVPSIFVITESKDKNSQDVDWEIEDKKIIIKLSSSNFEKYKNLRMNDPLKPILASLFVLPVLTELIADLKEGNTEQYEDRKWYRVIVKRLKQLGYDIESGAEYGVSAYSMAQMILGNTLSNSLNSLEEILIRE